MPVRPFARLALPCTPRIRWTGFSGRLAVCRFPFNLSVLIFQLATLSFASCHRPLSLHVSGQGGIDLVVCRELEDAGSGRIHEQVKADLAPEKRTPC